MIQKNEVVQSLQYTGENAGQVQQFCQNKPIEDAPVLKVMDPLKIIGISVYATKESTPDDGVKHISLLPTDWIVKDKEQIVYKLTNEEYTQL